MDEFILPIDRTKFSSTNSAWNDLMLNDPWSVGYVSTLIELHPWKNKEEWENFYFQSGEERNKLLTNNKELLNDYSLPLKDKNKICNLDWSLKNLNTQYGRTVDDLKQKAQTLYNATKDNGHNLTIEDCYECVRFRVICETWNGIILRENNTIEKLKSIFPKHIFKKTSGEIDHTYAVDYEVYLSDKLICGLQIKPKSYLWSTPYIRKARSANKLKNNAYTRQKGVPVFDIIASNKGDIYNSEALNEIKTRSV